MKNETTEWQTAEFNRHAQFNFIIPHQFLMLCKLVNITPQQMLIDFMDNLSCGSWKREGREKAKEKLMEYFLEHGYGQEYYSSSEIKSIFGEMDAIGMLFPVNADEEVINEHTRWREIYHTWWFKKWFEKDNRII